MHTYFVKFYVKLPGKSRKGFHVSEEVTGDFDQDQFNEITSKAWKKATDYTKLNGYSPSDLIVYNTEVYDIDLDDETTYIREVRIPG